MGTQIENNIIKNGFYNYNGISGESKFYICSVIAS